MKYILIIALLFSQAQAQTSVIQLKEVLIRYNSAIVPQPFCQNNVCAYRFTNVNGDTLAEVYNEGVIDLRSTVTIKDTLTYITIIEPTNTLSATRHLFNGSTAIGFNPANYYVKNTNGSLPLKIYQKSDNSLYVEIGNNLTWWHKAMPPANTIAGTRIRRFVLP